MPDIQSALRSYQISWLRRACNNVESNLWRDWLDELTTEATGLSFAQLMMAGSKKWKRAENQIRNTFWKEVFKSYNRMVDSMKELDLSNILTMSIWNSTFFTSANSIRGFLNPNSVRFQGISDFVHAPLDVIGPEGKIMTHAQCIEKYGRDIPDEILVSVSQAINNIDKSLIPRNLIGFLLPACNLSIMRQSLSIRKGVAIGTAF